MAWAACRGGVRYFRPVCRRNLVGDSAEVLMKDFCLVSAVQSGSPLGNFGVLGGGGGVGGMLSIIPFCHLDVQASYSRGHRSAHRHRLCAQHVPHPWLRLSWQAVNNERHLLVASATPAPSAPPPPPSPARIDLHSMDPCLHQSSNDLASVQTRIPAATV